MISNQLLENIISKGGTETKEQHQMENKFSTDILIEYGTFFNVEGNSSHTMQVKIMGDRPNKGPKWTPRNCPIRPSILFIYFWFTEPTDMETTKKFYFYFSCRLPGKIKIKIK